MTEGQKRRVGQGMKPRGETADKPEGATIAPTTEGQPESIIQPILDRQEGEQGSEHLESDSVQNLESAETAGVAPSLTEEAPREDDFSSLKTALAQSGEGPIVIQVPSNVVVMSTQNDGLETMAEGMTGKFLHEIEDILAVDPGAKKIHTLGEQDNGDYKAVVTIREGYIEAVRQWAESDGKTLEEWLTDQLSGYLENWGSPAKGR